MQQELLAENPGTAIRILAVNEVGHEAGNSLITGKLPWLQDTPATDAYGHWKATFRDVILLDRQNLEIVRFNVTRNDLRNSGNYVQLKNLFKKAAGEN
jgi:hypothetical protein